MGAKISWVVEHGSSSPTNPLFLTEKLRPGRSNIYVWLGDRAQALHFDHQYQADDIAARCGDPTRVVETSMCAAQPATPEPADILHFPLPSTALPRNA